MEDPVKKFAVFIDEVRQNFVFGDAFEGQYVRTVTLSDGSSRTVKLTPVIRDGEQLLELDVDGHVTYMGPNGTTTNRDTLMVAVREWPEESAAAAVVG
jgi:hypothetical protein